MLRRVFRHTDMKTKQVSYPFLVKPLLKYGYIVWNPFTKKDIKRFEKIRNVALRFIFRLRGWVSFIEIKANVGQDSLVERHKSLRACFYAKADDRGITILIFCRLINVVILDRMQDCMLTLFGLTSTSIPLGQEQLESWTMQYCSLSLGFPLSFL